MLCGLSHSRHSLPQSTLSTLIQGLVISRVLYCLTVYGVCQQDADEAYPEGAELRRPRFIRSKEI